MNLLIKGILAGFWLIIVPAASGVPFLRKKDRYTPGECFLTGYLFLFALAEVMILAAYYLRTSLHVLVQCYAAAAGLAALCGIICLRKQAGRLAEDIKCSVREASPYFWCALILIFMQMCILVVYTHFDADDAFYVATATTAVQTDSIFAINPYTGFSYGNYIPSRYILSPFPIFLAVVSRLCGGLHPAITAHTVFPPVFQMLSYMVLYQIGRRWFRSDSMRRGIFLFLAAALNCFTSYSVYNAGTFQMVRIWQGKALLASAFLPLLFFLSLSIVMEEKPEYPWLLLFLANTSCCLLSSMGILLAPLVQGIFLLFALFRFKNPKRLLQGILCCMPSLILGVIYLFVLKA